MVFFMAKQKNIPASLRAVRSEAGRKGGYARAAKVSPMGPMKSLMVPVALLADIDADTPQKGARWRTIAKWRDAARR